MPTRATDYDLQRLENVLAYERMKRPLEAEHRGQWVAIARGLLLAHADAACSHGGSVFGTSCAEG